MELNSLTKKYQQIDEQMVLFNDEYYLGVEKLDITALRTAERENLFNRLYDFDCTDMQVEIDVSEEDKGCWYLQLLVPHVLTLPEAAKRRIEKGIGQLSAHLAEKADSIKRIRLQGEEIYDYVKRYNPDVERIA